VLRPKGMSWRSKKEEGGGCLYDYAAHPVNLVNWFFGLPDSVGASVMTSIFSKEPTMKSAAHTLCRRPKRNSLCKLERRVLP